MTDRTFAPFMPPLHNGKTSTLRHTVTNSPSLPPFPSLGSLPAKPIGLPSLHLYPGYLIELQLPRFPARTAHPSSPRHWLPSPTLKSSSYYCMAPHCCCLVCTSIRAITASYPFTSPVSHNLLLHAAPICCSCHACPIRLNLWLHGRTLQRLR